MSAAFVVDASMAFAWVLPSQASSEAEALLERIEACTRLGVWVSHAPRCVLP